MPSRILVTYASAMGSTVEVAAAIGDALRARGDEVDIRPIHSQPSLEGYQAVVIGSAVQRGLWLPEAVEFVRANQQTLNRLPVAVFCVHIANLGSDKASQKKRLAYLDPIRALLNPVAEGFFAGRFDRRGARELLPGFLTWLVPTLDLRNWQAIRAWAAELALGVGA